MVFALGMGWTEVAAPGSSPFAICGGVEVSWDETNRPHVLELTILDDEGHPLLVQTPMGDQPFRVQANFEVGRPPGERPGRSFNMPVAMNVGPLPLRPGQGYLLQGRVDGEVLDQVPFLVRPHRPPELPARG